MTVVGADATITGIARLLGVVLVCYLVAGQPLLGAWNARRFERQLAAGSAGASVAASVAGRSARMHRYSRSIALECVLIAGALIVVGTGTGPRLSDVGIGWPRVSHGHAPFTIVGALGVVGSIGVLIVLRQLATQRPIAMSGPPAITQLAPTDDSERRRFGLLVVTSGLGEELAYRGVLLGVFAAIAPGIAPARAVVVAALVTALAHAYQGVSGMLTNGVVGGCLAVVYLGTASLLLPVLLHIALDLRLVAAASRGATPAPARLAAAKV